MQTAEQEIPEAVQSRRQPRPRLSHELDLNPVPFAVPIPRPAPSNHGMHRGKYQTTVVFTDTHVPYHDQPALEVIYGAIRDIQPARVIHLGDLLDCATISKYVKPRDVTHTVQDEIDGARTILHQVSQLAPAAEKWLLGGNHEARLDTLLDTLPGTHRELNQLRALKTALTWPELLQLESIGWGFVPTYGQAHRNLLAKLITIHGTVVRKWSGASAKGEWEKYGQSGLSGHVHRVGQFYTTDRNGHHVWTECGCTCDLKPRYMPDPNWAHAFVLVHHTPDGSRFSVEPVYIHEGRALFRQTEYRAA
jgi:hypothetical protein